MGLRPVRTLVQRDSLDEETRIELWNITLGLERALTAAERHDINTVLDTVTSSIWAWSFNRPRDEEPSTNQVWGGVKNQILKAEWVDTLGLIEEIIGYAKRFEQWKTEDVVPVFIKAFNGTFENFLVGYRFIDLKLVPLDSEVDLEAINTALDDAKPFKGARHHLEQATGLLADRKKPDYPNSIKESISAVESVCRVVTGEQTLGGALKKLKDSGVKIHPALEGGWSKMYGWTSDADGIRHSAIEAPDADQALAKYMLVACSAFVSLVIELGRKADLT
jgi:AbiJ N-terminal domain 4